MGAYKNLDAVLRKERFREYKTPLLIAIVFLGFIVIALPFISGKVIEIQGIAVRLTANLSDDGNKPVMFVKLNNGSTVRASTPKNLHFKKGAIVNLLQKESLIGTRTYVVVGYPPATLDERR